jgi:hypothetical protein
MAQAGHAVQLGYRSLDPAARGRWAARGFALSVRTADDQIWRQAAQIGAPTVHDAGFTEVRPGTATARFVLLTAAGGARRGQSSDW